MSASEILAPHGHEFERFLYAYVGEDRNGSVVTVLSALARLDLDPWSEAAELSAMGREGASSRLGALLSRFHDVPALGRDHLSVAQELARFLPERPSRDAARNAARDAAAPVAAKKGGLQPSEFIWMALLALVFLVQWLFVGWWD